MSLWQNVVQTALVGSDRQSPTLPPIEGELGKILAKLDTADIERKLLGSAASIALYQRAGKVPVNVIEEITPCDLEDLPRCSHKTAQYLKQILHGEYAQILPDCLAIIAANGKRVSEENLPAILALGRKQTELQKAIKKVVGKRGNWLAAQNPDWNYAIAIDDESIWETGRSAARTALLQRLRAENPQRARKLVVSTWNKDKADDRAVFLSTFETGLSMEDEAFLEENLGDRSKQVRRIAADLLARLPESQLCQRMSDRVSGLVQFTLLITLKVQINLPQTCDDATIRDGIESQPPAGIGEKAWWLQQMVAAIPLAYWCRDSLNPSQLIRVAIDSEWKQILVDGWAKAAWRQQNQEWAEALLSCDIKSHENLLIQVLSLTRRNALLLEILRQNPQPFSRNHLALSMLRQSHYTWTEQLTRVVLEKMRYYITIRNDLALLSDFENFFRYMTPSLFQEISSTLTAAAQSSYWAKPMEKCLAILQIRYDIFNDC